uniref:Uncharacterized protein n=1 Tax=Acanthochromis polyacanthus TaxID=80966 RepID=A0A3Q1E9X4_9TELE
VMQASSPVDGNVCLLTVRRQELLAELKQAIKNWAVLSHINCKEFDVIIAVILGHLLSAAICNFTYIYLHLSVEAIVEQQVVCHTDPVGLHGMPLSIVIISNITCEEDKNKTKYLKIVHKLSTSATGPRHIRNVYFWCLFFSCTFKPK